MTTLPVCWLLTWFHVFCLLLSAFQVHYIVDEMLLNGCIVDTNKQNILEPVQLLETVST
jgi:AP-4 complex subunit sigma-1